MSNPVPPATTNTIVSKIQSYLWVTKENQKLKYISNLLHFVPRLLSPLMLLNTPKHKPLYFKVPTPSQRAQLMDLEMKMARYQAYIVPQTDKSGFILTKDCDSMLFTGLAAFGTTHKLDIKAALDKDSGLFLRKPEADGVCFDCKTGVGIGSASSFSRDMAMGLLWYIVSEHYHNNNETTINGKHIADYVLDTFKKNNWIMGYGDPFRLIAMSGLESTLSELVDRLGTKQPYWRRKSYYPITTGLSDYQAHLEVVHILLRGMIHGGLSNRELAGLKSYSDAKPNNPLFTATYKIYTGVYPEDEIKLLLSEKYWPNDRLPDNREYSTDWIFQREEGADWLPSGGEGLGGSKTGGDFLFLSNLVLTLLVGN